MLKRVCLLLIPFAATGLCADTPAWVAASNRHAHVLLDSMAKFSPEGAASLGVEGIDEKVMDLGPGIFERSQDAARQARAELARRLAAEKDPLVRQDLEIMLAATDRSIRNGTLTRKYMLPYYNPAQTIFGSMRGLLDPQIAEKRRSAALVRLRRYTGDETGYTPLTVLAEQRIRERLKEPGLLGPFRDELEKDLKRSPAFIDGVGELFRRFNIAGYAEPLAKLKTQVAAYNEFLKKEIMPRARTDFRLPPELYAADLDQFGVDIAPAQLAAMAHRAFDEIQSRMQQIAPTVAKARGWSITDYRDVIRELKKEQLTGDGIVTHYRARIAEIEDIIRREKLVTLPQRPALMRLASPAESAGQPAPHMRPPRLVGNTGESGEFVLPLVNPMAEGKRMDDFTFAAASWTLSCHEARPGHEMQFSAMMEHGVSIARAVYAFNSTNVEGWGLYSEAIMFPFMPPEGQLISLQHRLMRAARAFLDPELHMGKITAKQAYERLTNDVVVSDAMATQEVDRYTFRAPGQATSYFYGFTKLNALRAEVENKLGSKFDQKAFHDYILSQGLLPPALQRKAVLEHFVR